MSRKRKQQTSKRSKLRMRPASLAAAAVLTGSGGLFSLMAQPAAAADPGPAYWMEILHNISGSLNDGNGNPLQAEHFISHVRTHDPLVASAVEVCQSQYLRIARDLQFQYHMYFVVAKERANNCSGNGQDGNFGNILLLHKTFDHARDNSNWGWKQPGAVQNEWTHIFSRQNNGDENKRSDCAKITVNAKKFSVCTTHTTGGERSEESANRAQLDEIRYSHYMQRNALLMGDLNPYLVEDVTNRFNTWRWDEAPPGLLDSFTPTHALGKLDWVLGATDADFFRLYDSSVQGKGRSDHHLLHAFVIRTGTS